MTNTDTLVVKSTRFVLELTPQTGCAADDSAGDTTRIAKRDEPELNASSNQVPVYAVPVLVPAGRSIGYIGHWPAPPALR